MLDQVHLVDMIYSYNLVGDIKNILSSLCNVFGIYLTYYGIAIIFQIIMSNVEELANKYTAKN